MNRLARFARCRTGTAAIEFALTVPLMLLVLFGAVELSLAIAADRRVVEIAGSTGDLVARADRTIDQSEVIDIMRIGGYLLNPSPVSPLRITISNVSSSPTNAADTKVVWRCEYVGGSSQTTCTCPNTQYKLPDPKLVGVNDSVIVAVATYQYQPMGLGTVLGDKPFSLANTRFMKPRTQSAKLRFSNGTVC